MTSKCKRKSAFKGHNWGLCRKCGKFHSHGMKGKHHSEESKAKSSKAMTGRPPWNKGLTKETDERVKRQVHVAWNKGLTKETDERIRKMSQKTSRTVTLQFQNGRVSPMKGYNYTPLQRIEKSRAMLNSPIHKTRVQEGYREKARKVLREVYDIPEDVVFYPARAYEHWFARNVLIGGRSSSGFCSQGNLREHERERGATNLAFELDQILKGLIDGWLHIKLEPT